MSIEKTIAASSGAFSTFAVLTDRLARRLTGEVYNFNAYTPKPPAVVSIVIPAFNEEDYIEATLKSILSQNILFKYKDYFECIVVDNESTDRTAEIAKEYCQVISAPRGKLNARDAGIKHAVGDVIVSADADTYYPPNWLNLILRHFHNPEVVAVHGPFLFSDASFPMRIAAVWNSHINPHIRRTLSGANSAFRRQAYFEVGGFDLSINQFDKVQIIREEEIVFGDNLREIGKVVFEVKAPVFTSLRSGGAKVLIETERKLTPFQAQVKRGERF